MPKILENMDAKFAFITFTEAKEKSHSRRYLKSNSKVSLHSEKVLISAFTIAHCFYRASYIHCTHHGSATDLFIKLQ